jgi:hypothetical protein
VSNDFLIDRELQRTKTFTRISGINTQDYALQETMEKPFCDRTKEKLGRRILPSSQPGSPARGNKGCTGWQDVEGDKSGDT